MSTRTIWTCDGCDEERVVEDHPSDWKLISVTLEGFTGYPVSDLYNAMTDYHLCPDCQRLLVRRADPREWPRVKEEEEA